VKVALLAGGGRLPAILREAIAFHHCLELDTWPHSLGAVQALAEALIATGCDSFCLAGSVDRGRFKDLDAGGLWVARRAGADAGDGQLLDALVAYLGEQGLAVIGASELLPSLRTPVGLLSGEGVLDAATGLDRARNLGLRDLGQAVIRCGHDLWLEEDAAGTDALIRRARHNQASPKTLFKAAKPQQDLRVDMPAWGRDTVQLAIECGLSGLVFEAERTLALDLDASLRLARQAGLSVVGVGGMP